MPTDQSSPRVIVLNGGSSSGKSAIVRDLQAILPEPWLHLGVDELLAALPPSMLDSAAGIGFGPAGEVSSGAGFRALELAWLTGIAAMVRAGANVIIDDVFLGGGASQQRTRTGLAGLPVLWVGVRCDPAVASARERARGDRVLGMAASQAEPVHRGTSYDLQVDTSATASADCARTIADHLAGRG